MSASPQPAPAPLAPPAATGVAIALALSLIALGVVAGRDALLDSGLISGSPWITGALRAADGWAQQAWMLPVTVVVAITGAWLVWIAIKPRRRTHLPLQATGTWIARRDVAHLVQAAAERTTGVASASANGSGRSITINVSLLAGFDAQEVEITVTNTVAQELSPLSKPPRVKMRMRSGDES